MTSQDLLQDTAEYNRKVNLARKMLKSKKCPLSTLPLMSRRPVQSRMPATVPVESGRVRRRRVSSSKAHNKPGVSEKPNNTKHKCNHALYTPMAEVRRNYETLLSWLKPVAIKASRGDIGQTSGQGRSAPGPSGLPTAQYTVSSEFIDELLDELTISDSTTECRSSSRSVPDLSNLPLTQYRVSSSFIDEMLDSLVIGGEALEGYQLSMTFVDNLLNSL